MNSLFTRLIPKGHVKLLSAGSGAAPLLLSMPSRKALLSKPGQQDGARSAFAVDSVVKVFETHAQAEHAVRELHAAGIDMAALSIAAKDLHLVEQVSGYYTAGDRMLHWGKLGAFWGGLWGTLFDSALFAIPGIGPVLLAGPLVSWVVAALEGALVFGSISAIGAGLLSIGIPENSVIEYDIALRSNKFLLVVHGLPVLVSRARDIVGGTRHSYYTVAGKNVFAK